MSHLLSCTALQKSFGARPLFENLTLTIHERERIGLIGPNGAGKSTFLKILAGLEDLDSGQIVTRRKLRIAYLPQTEDFDLTKGVDEILLSHVPESLSEAERYARIGEIVSIVDLPTNNPLASELSGGFRKRLGIATRLLQDPDLLLLDEPTNHLDLEGIIWFEKFLLETTFAFIVISHDRTFLENVTGRTVEVNRRYPEGFISVDGNYAEFLERRDEILQQLERQQQNLSNSVRRETEWLRRQPKARTTKSSARIQQAEEMISQLQTARSRSQISVQSDVDFSSTGRQTKQLIVVEHLTKSFGERRIVKGLDLTLLKGMKLGVVGRNGSGKSTLLKLLAGEIEPDSGKLWRAPDLRVVTFDQQRKGLNQNVSLRRYLAPDSDSVVFQDRLIHVASYAARYLFKGEHLDTPVSKLSGGEQARLLIAKLILQPADVLLLDEPTNDLDIDTLEALEESLDNFPGAVVLITHDRTLLQGVCDLFLVLHKGKAQYVASYDQWQKVIEKQEAETVVAPTQARSNQKDRKEIEKVEKAILKAETAVTKIEHQIAEEAQAGRQTKDLCKDLEVAKKNVQNLYTRWEELESS